MYVSNLGQLYIMGLLYITYCRFYYLIDFCDKN